MNSIRHVPIFNQGPQNESPKKEGLVRYISHFRQNEKAVAWTSYLPNLEAGFQILKGLRSKFLETPKIQTPTIRRQATWKTLWW